LLASGLPLMALAAIIAAVLGVATIRRNRRAVGDLEEHPGYHRGDEAIV
jgi:hypothetical protein